MAHEAGFVTGELFSEVPNIKFLKALRQDAAMVVSKARHVEWPGHVLHRYCEVESGRVYADEQRAEVFGKSVPATAALLAVPLSPRTPC